MKRVKASPPRSTGHRFGAHLSIAGGVQNALQAALRLRCQTVQVFVKNQRQWAAGPLPAEDVAAWHKLLETPGFGPVVAHATYLINLASPDSALWARSRRAFADELLRCDVLNIGYMVVHPGSPTDGDREAGTRRVADALNRIFADHPALRVMVLLETTAGQGATLGRTFAELAAIRELVAEPQRIGICADTCHLFVAGYDLRDPATYAQTMAEAEQTIGIKHIRCWHLNDCKGACGSNLDRHDHIGRGQLGRAAFRNLLGDARFTGVPMILETPKGEDDNGRDWDRINLRTLRALAREAARGARPRA